MKTGLVTTLFTRCSRAAMAACDSSSSAKSLGARLIDLKTAADHTTALSRAAQTLKDGGVIALPTDTIYGLAATIDNTERIYQIKGRDIRKPVALCLGDVDNIYEWADVTCIPSWLLHKLLPGPVTLVLTRTTRLPSSVNPGCASVGIRVPAHAFTRALCRLVGAPLVLTSANRSDDESATCVEEFSRLWEELDLVVDGGDIAGGADGDAASKAGSTVVDLTVEGRFDVLRRGCAVERTVKVLEEAGLRRKD